MLVSNLVEYLADDFVGTLVPLEIAVVPVTGKHLLVQRNGDLPASRRARASELSFGVGEQLRGLDRCLHHVMKFRRVQFFAEPPSPSVGGALRQVGLHPRIEIGQSLLGQGSRLVIARPHRRTGRNICRKRIDKVAVTFVFLDRGGDEDRIGVSELRLCLIEEARDLDDAGDDVADPHFFGGVFLGKRQEQAVTYQFNIDGGIVFVVLILVELQQ